MALPTKKIWYQKILKNILYHIGIMGFIHIPNRLAVKHKKAIGS